MEAEAPGRQSLSPVWVLVFARGLLSAKPGVLRNPDILSAGRKALARSFALHSCCPELAADALSSSKSDKTRCQSFRFAFVVIGALKSL